MAWVALGLTLFGFALGLTTSAAADEPLRACDDAGRARASGPLGIGWLDGRLGTPRRACPRGEIALAGEGYAVIAPEDYYGHVRAQGRVMASVDLGDLELFLEVEAFRYQLVIASVQGEYLGPASTSGGATGRIYEEGPFVLSVMGRVILPSAQRTEDRIGGRAIALDAGLVGAVALHPNLRAHAFTLVLGSTGRDVHAPADPWVGLRVGAGLEWIPWTWLSFVLEALGGFGYRSPLDLFALSAGARVALGEVVGLELSAGLPIAGAEPALLSAWLGLSFRPE